MAMSVLRKGRLPDAVLGRHEIRLACGQYDHAFGIHDRPTRMLSRPMEEVICEMPSHPAPTDGHAQTADIDVT